MTKRYLVLILLALTVFVPSAHAQEEILEAFGVNQPLRFSGSVGFLGEVYVANGIAGRRDPATARVFARASASGYGLSYGLNLLLSTEETRLRQSFNRVDLHLNYKWISADAGTISPSFSEYSLQGVTLMGGYVDLTPGRWQLTLTGGRSRRAVEPTVDEGFRKPSYRQWMYAGRIGYDFGGGTYLRLNTVFARDQVSSLDGDTGEALPAASLNVTPIAGIVLFDGNLRLEGQMTASAFTRDLRAAETDEELGPLFFPGVFPARIGSHTDYAGRLNASINVRPVQFSIAYERIQPGFESLGVPRIRTDQEIIRLRPQVSLFDNRLRLGFDVGQRRNNLLGDLASTLRRRQGGVNVSWRVMKGLSVNANYRILDNTSKPQGNTPGLIRTQRISNTFSLAPVYTLQGAFATHTMAFSATLQGLSDESEDVALGLRPGAGFENRTATLGYGLTFTSGLNLNASGSYVDSDTRNADLTSMGLNLGAGYSFFERKLIVSANAGWSRNSTTVATPQGGRLNDSQQIIGTLNASYRVFKNDAITLSVRGLSSSAAGGASFQEVQSSLRFEHRF